ncbi:MAG TPA: tripartite tricarboxylate transporter TctB family protein, partial [Actinomycetales bacterium]|nr:tripartite tricarboxylate transporter TctB family protein [Actinomycetales bacterium]
FGLATVRYSAMVCRIPVRYVVPGVLGLTMVGAFGLRNNPFDVVVTAVVGAVAFLLQKMGISWIPLALGLVLGKVMEQRFQQSVLIAPTRGGLGQYWFTRPVTLVLILIVVLLLVAGARQLLRSSKTPVEAMDEDEVWAARLGFDEPTTNDDDSGVSGSGSTVKVALHEDVEEPAEAQQRWVSLRTSNIIVSIGVIALAVFVMVQASGWLERARQLPVVVSIMLILLSVLLLVMNVIPRLGASRTTVFPFEGVPWLKWSILVGGLLLVAFVQKQVGLLESLLVYMAVVTYVLCDPRKSLALKLRQAVVCSVVLAVAMHLAFERLLDVPLPSGLIF